MTYGFDQLATLPRARLRQLWRGGVRPDAERLAGWVFRGRNTALLARLTGGGPFAKGFIAVGGAVHGCNFPVVVRGEDWRIDATRPFGFYRVEPIGGEAGDAVSGAFPGSPPGLLLDYGRARPDALRSADPGPFLRIVERVARPLRDIVVRPLDAAEGVYLGRAYFGERLRLHVSFFVLERWTPLEAASLDVAPAASDTGG